MRTRSAIVWLLLSTGAASGQQALFLCPESPRVAAEAPIRVHLESGTAAVAWDDARVRLLFVLGQDTRENMERAPAGADAAGAVALAAPGQGAAAVGLELKPAVEEMDAAALRKFASAWCDGRVPESVKGKVKVRRVESCRTLVRIGEGGSAAALAETALRAEIDVRMDPTRMKAGSDLAFAVSMSGEDLEDARVFATCAATGKTQEAESREEGAGSFRITDAGRWRVEFHHLAKAEPGGDADWVLMSGTLTFEVPLAEVKP